MIGAAVVLLALFLLSSRGSTSTPKSSMSADADAAMAAYMRQRAANPLTIETTEGGVGLKFDADPCADLRTKAEDTSLGIVPRAAAQIQLALCQKQAVAERTQAVQWAIEHGTSYSDAVSHFNQAAAAAAAGRAGAAASGESIESVAAGEVAGAVNNALGRIGFL